VKLSPSQRWALDRIATGDERVETAGTAEQSLGGATYRALLRLGCIAERRDERGVRRVGLTDAGRKMIARAA
jgi:hypothetical protein